MNEGAVLIVRVWHEGPTEKSELRIRMTGRQDVSDGVEDVKVAGSIPESLTYIQQWLEHLDFGRER